MVETAIIGTLVAGEGEGEGEGMAEGGGVLVLVQDQGQVGTATTMTTVLEIAGGRPDEDEVEDVVPEVYPRHEDEDEVEGVHQQREGLSLFLLTMVCPSSPLLFVTNNLTDIAPLPPPPTRRPTPPQQRPRPPTISDSNSDHPNCDCNTPAVQRTVQKEGVNKGRNFWKCGGGPEKDCDFFAWADGNLPPYSRTVSNSNIERMIPAKRKVGGITVRHIPVRESKTSTNVIGITSTAPRPTDRRPIKTLFL